MDRASRKSFERRDDLSRRSRSRRHSSRREKSRGSSYDFARRLFNAGTESSKKYRTATKRFFPLFSEFTLREPGGTIRVKTLQKMIIINLKKEIALVVDDMYRTRTATDEQMGRARVLTEQYGRLFKSTA